MFHRIISRLDVKGPNLVKGIHLEGLRVLGDPTEFAEYYYKQGIDEIIYMDVVASLYGRNSLHDFILKTAKRSFIPITVGGGIRTIDDIKSILRSGADKVVINTQAIKNPNFIEEASKKFGSSTIVVAIEVARQKDGKYIAFTDNGREQTKLDAQVWAKRVSELGAGEILLTSIDNEGTGQGFDNFITNLICSESTVPVIAHGGAGKLSHISNVIIHGKADAIAISSILHYEAIHKLFYNFKEIEEGNFQFIKHDSRKIPKYIEPTSIFEIKKYLIENGISCRPILKKEN